MLEDIFTCTLLVKIKSMVHVHEWTPDMISDLIDGVNKFGHRWKRIKEEYKFSVSSRALTSKWLNIRHLVALEDGKWKMVHTQPGNYNWPILYLSFTIIMMISYGEHDIYLYLFSQE